MVRSKTICCDGCLDFVQLSDATVREPCLHGEPLVFCDADCFRDFEAGLEEPGNFNAAGPAEKLDRHARLAREKRGGQ